MAFRLGAASADGKTVHFVEYDGFAFTASDRVLHEIKIQDDQFRYYDDDIPGRLIPARRSPWHWYQIGMQIIPTINRGVGPTLLSGTIPKIDAVAEQDLNEVSGGDVDPYGDDVNEMDGAGGLTGMKF